MLPDVVSEHARLPSIIGLSWLGRVSIASLPSLLTVTNTQPEPNTRPPAALKSVWNFSNAAEVAVDCGEQGTFWLAAVWSHDLPEHGVVGVAAHAVADAGADCFRHGAEIAQHVADRLVCDLRMVLREIVQVVMNAW